MPVPDSLMTRRSAQSPSRSSRQAAPGQLSPLRDIVRHTTIRLQHALASPCRKGAPADALRVARSLGAAEWGQIATRHFANCQSQGRFSAAPRAPLQFYVHKCHTIVRSGAYGTAAQAAGAETWANRGLGSVPVRLFAYPYASQGFPSRPREYLGGLKQCKTNSTGSA